MGNQRWLILLGLWFHFEEVLLWRDQAGVTALYEHTSPLLSSSKDGMTPVRKNLWSHASNVERCVQSGDDW